ncbi:hypothetical protein EVJ58_g1215 [Rhodofomes roseus]|uniref:Uncharacterized protein n=1 Tax=Rhodofomes roseus TaxID=34475 RepID=A0A4Y9Z2P7_9APHY|nr:hypothetical protein EVJ58_g1215 [Rhodofomes roseus]
MSERPVFAARRAQLLADNEATKTHVFWKVKKVAMEKSLDMYDEADTPAEKLDDKAHECRMLFLSDAS